MATEPEVRTPDTSEEQSYWGWAKELTQEANSNYLHYSDACTVATTVLLGFIFNSVYNGTSSTAAQPSSGVHVSLLIKMGWFAAFASLTCGLAYLRCSANTLFETARKARKIAKEYADGHQEEGQKLYDDMICWLQGGKKGNSADNGPYNPGYGYVVAQACLLGIAIVLTSWQLFFR